MDSTTNYGFSKPTLTDNALITVLSENFESIDNTIKSVENKNLVQTSGGTGTVITLDLPTTLENGYQVTFIASGNNSGSATTINGKNVYKPASINAPNFYKDRVYIVYYNLSSDCFFWLASSSGNVTTSQVLEGYTFSNDIDTDLVGSMINRPSQVTALSVGSSGTNKYFRIPNGAYLTNAGSGYPEIVVSATAIDSNIVSGNIKSGVTIAGVTGSSNVVNTSDAVLNPQYLLAGQSGYDDGVKKNGTMVDRTGDTACVSSSVSGTTLKLKASEGYRDGTNDNVTITDADFIASNIISGKNIFGLAGTATPESLGGMTAVSGSVYLTYQGASDSSVIQLPYAPSRVVVYFPYTLGIRGAGYWLASEGLASSGVHTSNDHSAGSIAISGTTMTLTSYYYAGTRYWIAFA